MSVFKVGCSPITGTIYAGYVREKKNGEVVWANNRHEVTEEAVDAVVERLKMLPNMMEKYKWKVGDKEYVLKLVEYEPKKKEEKE